MKNFTISINFKSPIQQNPSIFYRPILLSIRQPVDFMLRPYPKTILRSATNKEKERLVADNLGATVAYDEAAGKVAFRSGVLLCI